MKEWIAVAVLLYSVPLFALLLTWKKPLWQALRGIVLSEVLGILCFFPLYALVGMLSWQWFRWGGVSLQEILSFWKGGGATAALWIGPGVGETALVLLLRWVVETVRQRLGHDRGSTQRRGGLMELRQTIRTGIRNIRRAWWEPGLMLALSALLVAAAWLWIPAPLVENPVQTELLYIQVDSGTHGMVRWKPKTMVERQTARAIVDHMATLHKKNTLCPAHKALEGRPNMYIHFRTEDSYQVVALQVGGGQRRGVSYPRDGGGLALAAQVLQPQDLEAYVLAQIHGALSGESL